MIDAFFHYRLICLIMLTNLWHLVSSILRHSSEDICNGVVTQFPKKSPPALYQCILYQFDATTQYNSYATLLYHLNFLGHSIQLARCLGQVYFEYYAAGDKVVFVRDARFRPDRHTSALTSAVQAAALIEIN